MNYSLERFVKEFEQHFSDSLITPQMIDRPAEYTRFFLVYVDKLKGKYSDWDIVCSLNPDCVSKALLHSMNGFMREYAGLENVGLLLPRADKYLNHTFHHIQTTSVLHYMALFRDVASAPFLDLTIKNVNRNIAKEAFPEIFDEEFKSWIMLTAWRKFKNGRATTDMSDYNQFIAYYMNVFEGSPTELKSDPEALFIKSIPEEYSDAVEFLKT